MVSETIVNVKSVTLAELTLAKTKISSVFSLKGAVVVPAAPADKSMVSVMDAIFDETAVATLKVIGLLNDTVNTDLVNMTPVSSNESFATARFNSVVRVEVVPFEILSVPRQASAGFCPATRVTAFKSLTE